MLSPRAEIGAVFDALVLGTGNYCTAPNLKVTPKAFGVGRVFPIAHRYC
jgi:hypothetical protein